MGAGSQPLFWFSIVFLINKIYLTKHLNQLKIRVYRRSNHGSFGFRKQLILIAARNPKRQEARVVRNTTLEGYYFLFLVIGRRISENIPIPKIYKNSKFSFSDLLTDYTKLIRIINGV